jgi:integrase
MTSIAKRPDGRWRARYRDESGHEFAKHFGRKADAQAWLDTVTTAIGSGAYVSPRQGQESFAEFYADWSERQIWVPTTRRAMDLAAHSTTLFDVALRNIRKSHVEKWVKTMTTSLASSTVRTRFNNVRATLRAAVADHRIPVDPSVGVVIPRQRRTEIAMAIPTPQEVGKLLDVADGPFKTFVALCAFAGLRLGEAAALKVGDVDFLHRSFLVARQVQRSGRGTVDIRAPKYGSERIIYLPQTLVEMIAQRIEAHLGDNDADRWLFVGEGTDPPHQNTVGHRWRQTRQKAGLVNVKLHDLRHFFASGLIAAGCDVVTVQRAMGHSSPTTTLRTYAHLWPSAEDRTRSAAEAMMTAAQELPEPTTADSMRTAAGQ